MATDREQAARSMMQAGIGSVSGKEILRDDYNIGRFGEFDRFQDERSVAPEMFERPQSPIRYNEQGYTLPESQPDSWLGGYSRPGDVVEQERGVYPFVKRHAPEWSKDIYRDIKGGWEGTSLNQNINPRGMNQGLLGTQVAQSMGPNWYKWYDKLIKRFGKEKGSELWHLYAANDRGIGSLDEYQMAELTQKQKDMMGNPLNTPDFGVSKEDLWNKVKDTENKKWDLQWGVQEPTTQEEYDDYYRQLQAGTVGNWVT